MANLMPVTQMKLLDMEGTYMGTVHFFTLKNNVHNHNQHSFSVTHGCQLMTVNSRQRGNTKKETVFQFTLWNGAFSLK